MQSRLVFRRNRVILDHCSEGYYWPVSWYPEPPLIWCLPIRQETLNVSQIAVTFHGIRRPFFVQTWLQQYRRCPFFHSALSAIPCASDLCGVDVQWFSRIIPHKTFQILRNCQCEWLLVSSSAPGTSLGSSGFPEKFLFYTGRIVSAELPSLVPLQRIDDCFEIHILHWELCAPQLLLNHQKMFRSGYDCTSTSPARSPCYFRLQADNRYFACPSPVPLLLATPLVLHQRNWKCLDPSAQGFSVAPKDFFHQTISPWLPAVNQAIHAKNLFVLLIHHFYFCFRFLSFHAAGLPEALHLYLHFFRVLDFRCICWHQIQNPAMKMLKKLVKMTWKNSSRNQGLRMAHSLTYCNEFSCHFGWDVVFDRWSSGNHTHDPRRASREKELREFLQEASLSRISPILWNILWLLLLCAPRRWPSSPSSDSSMSSWSPTHQS